MNNNNRKSKKVVKNKVQQKPEILLLLPEYLKQSIKNKFIEQYRTVKPISTLNDYDCDVLISENTFDQFQGLAQLNKIVQENYYVLTFKGQQRKFFRNIFNSNVLDYLFKIIDSKKNQLIIYEALDIIKTLAKQFEIIENGYIMILKKIFASNSYHELIKQQICQIFASLALKSDKHQDIMLKMNSVKIISDYALNQLTSKVKQKQIHLVGECIANHFQYRTQQANFQHMLPLWQVFSKWIQLRLNEVDVCIKFGCLINWHNQDQLGVIIDYGAVPSLIELTQNHQLRDINLRTLIILAKNSNRLEYLINVGLLQCFKSSISYQKQKIINIDVYKQCYKKILQILINILDTIVNLKLDFVIQIADCLMKFFTFNDEIILDYVYQCLGKTLIKLQEWNQQEVQQNTLHYVRKALLLKVNKLPIYLLEIIQNYCKKGLGNDELLKSTIDEFDELIQIVKAQLNFYESQNDNK